MKLITNHQFLAKYPIRPEHRYLILGTIHPHNHDSFLIPFFYGNRLSFWRILSKAFPEELPNPENLNHITAFLEKFKIGVSDTILSCERKSPSALDKDLIPTALNESLLEQIKQSEIEHIFFTSGYQKNNAFNLFYKGILGNKSIKSKIRSTREGVFDRQIFGRPIRYTILYSPSGRANTGIVKSNGYREFSESIVGKHSTVEEYKVFMLKKAFSHIIC